MKTGLALAEPVTGIDDWDARQAGSNPDAPMQQPNTPPAVTSAHTDSLAKLITSLSEAQLRGLIAAAVARLDELAAAPNDPLSERESLVMRLIAFGHSNKAIATRLKVSVKTVETYKTRAMKKLSLHDRVGLVCYAADRGWLCPTGRA